jgi:hypothetical protein
MGNSDMNTAQVNAFGKEQDNHTELDDFTEGPKLAT